jgi:hypothetical protein
VEKYQQHIVRLQKRIEITEAELRVWREALALYVSDRKQPINPS